MLVPSLVVGLLAVQDLALPAPRPDLGSQLEEALAVGYLPLSSLQPVVERLEPAVYRGDLLALAFYRPSSGPESPPQLVLRESAYLRGERLLQPDEMVVDVFEYFAHALLLAWFHLEVVPSSPAEPAAQLATYSAWLRGRADELMPEPEPETRVAQYVTAISSFGSHLLGLRNEIERAARRQEDRTRLCAALRREAGLFGAWRRAFERESFRGYVGGDDAGAIALEDKERFVDVVLERDWRGDPSLDLEAELCRPVGESEGSGAGER